ncbi:MAG TPA: peptidylprolyl isomerase [Methylomirabilota bacterium]|nr:peptidylprolyl isomerase [Methylomirabilota bacterium]
MNWQRLSIEKFSLRASAHWLLASTLAIVCLAPNRIAAAENNKNDRVVRNGMLVSLEYTEKSSDGKLIETSKGRGPLRYIHGQKMLPPGLERALTGMKVGEQKKVTVKPEDAYGKFDPKAVTEVPKEKVPPNGLKVGAVLAYEKPDGSVAPMTVRQIKEKTVVMDMNHPLAGKTLIFDVKVVDIQPVPAPQSAQPAKPAAPAKPSAPAEPATPPAPAKK